MALPVNADVRETTLRTLAETSAGMLDKLNHIESRQMNANVQPHETCRRQMQVLTDLLRRRRSRRSSLIVVVVVAAVTVVVVFVRSGGRAVSTSIS